MILLGLIWSILALIFGAYILFAGRKSVWVTLGIIALLVTANLLAVLVVGGERGRDLIESQSWALVAISVAVGALGVAIARARPNLAVGLIGFIAGADLALWFYRVAGHIVTDVAQQSEQIAYWAGLALLALGGLFGLWLVRKRRDEALIVITMLVGARIIQDALGLSSTSSWTAIIMAAVALAGVLVQYAMFLRENKGGETEIRPQASSLAYFQDLELDL